MSHLSAFRLYALLGASQKTAGSGIGSSRISEKGKSLFAVHTGVFD